MTATADPVLRLRGVSAGYRSRFGERRVLAGLDLDVRRGETVAVLGANGSGKTTLLNVLAGTNRPTAGEVELFARPIGQWSRADVARVVTVLPQAMELPAGFRVAEVVALGRIPHGRRMFGSEAGDELAVTSALADAGAGDLAERPVTELSGGERQRVIVAMALAQAPALLLLDEPTVHLDLAHQLALVDLLARLRHVRQLTVVAVLHDLNLATRFADRIEVVHGGRLHRGTRDDGSVDLALVRRAFGVSVEEARTASGGRVLALGPIGDARIEPSPGSEAIDL
jgi:iron complex transport system ATP-binding protein